MNPDQLLEANILTILEGARLAPSVHNTQPWIVTVHGNSLSIALDSKYVLHDGDPTGRQTIISLGIFAEALSLAAKACGLQTTDCSYKDEVCVLHFDAMEPSSPEDAHLVQLLTSRSTDRSIYKPVAINQDITKKIEEGLSSDTVSVKTITDKPTLTKIANVTAKGIQLALTSPSFREELSHYLIVPGSHKKRGIATKSLYIPRLIQYFEPWMLRNGIMLQAEVSLEKKRWMSASGVVFICADGDMHQDWFEVGRTYLRTSLAIEDLGLSQATSAAIVEASDFHLDIETLLGTTQRIQAVIRIGKGSKKRHYSPRVEATELLATSS